MTLDIQDKKYIHSEITTEIKKALIKNNKAFRIELREEIDRQTGILFEKFEHHTKLIAELVTTRPSREEFNELTDDVRHLERRVVALGA